TNRALKRLEHSDVIYRTEREKYNAVADEIERIIKVDLVHLRDGKTIEGEIVKEDDKAVVVQPKESKQRETIEREKIDEIEHKGRPILVGTVSIEKSERLSAL